MNQNASNIHNHLNYLTHKTEDKILENDNECSVLSKKRKEEKPKEKYFDFVNKLKAMNKRRSLNNNLSSAKILKIIDINSKAEFKTDDKTKRNEIQPNGFIKSITRDNKALKTSLNLLKFDEVIANHHAMNRDDILNNCVYSIMEFFDNKKYNMERLRPLDFSDLKKILKEAQPQGVYKRLSITEKKKYMLNLLEMKNKQTELKNKRIEEMKMDGKQLYLIKIKNDCVGIPRFEFFISYSDYDIYMVKKCVINKWFLPPPAYYLERYPKQEEDKTEEIVLSNLY